MIKWDFNSTCIIIELLTKYVVGEEGNSEQPNLVKLICEYLGAFEN